MPIPKQKGKSDFERIKKEHLDEWICGHIEEVQYEAEHQFKGQFAKIGEAVRFKLRLEGYSEPKYSRWMTFSYSEKSHLYKEFVMPLVDGAYEYFDFEIKNLEKVRIKVMYCEDKYKDEVYQNIKLVKPLDGKISFDGPQAEVPTIQLEGANEKTEDEVPF